MADHNSQLFSELWVRVRRHKKTNREPVEHLDPKSRTETILESLREALNLPFNHVFLENIRSKASVGRFEHYN